MNKRRMRPSIMSIVGQVMFAIGLLVAFLTADTELNAAFAFLSVVFALIGLCLAVYADFKVDNESYKEIVAAGNPNAIQPPAALLSLGGMAIGLGVVGIAFIAMGDAWDNTLWVAIEVGSLIGGAILLALGFYVNKMRLEAAQKIISEKRNPLE